ncbi:hypothetical protein GCM10008968_08580 [Bacillus horti]|nr:YetF domain-containing protein [Bacillus horti]
MAFNTKIDMLHISYSLIMFGVIAILVTWLSLKSRRTRKWLSGHPTVVIEDGNILEENMRKRSLSVYTSG